MVKVLIVGNCLFRRCLAVMFVVMNIIVEDGDEVSLRFLGGEFYLLQSGELNLLSLLWVSYDWAKANASIKEESLLNNNSLLISSFNTIIRKLINNGSKMLITLFIKYLKANWNLVTIVVYNNLERFSWQSSYMDEPKCLRLVKNSFQVVSNWLAFIH